MIRKQDISRRGFLATTAAAAAGIVNSAYAKDKPKARTSAGPAPVGGEQFRFAQIGCGGKGKSDMEAMLDGGARLVAMCDVDPDRAGKQFKEHPDVPKFTDYRKMLDQFEKEIDGVVVSTPDHVHAYAAIDAMRRGKHVYVQKPLARTFEECQVLLDAAKKHNLVTQMGNQGHAGTGLLLWEQMMQQGALGDIREVHTWSNRPIWPQGMTAMPPGDPVPEGLDWENWIGPAAMRPYSKVYVPFKWRGWWDFGSGAMGDMACHNMDPAFWILKLGLPETVKAQTSAPAGVAYPEWSIIEYSFPPTAVCPKGVKMTWYDGKKMPAKPEGSHPELQLKDNGCMIAGSKMTAMGGSHASPPVPLALTGQAFGPAVKEVESYWRAELKKLEGCNHYHQWLRAAESKEPAKTGSNFNYAAPMTQAILLGCIALRFPGQELKWDNERRCFTNLPEANQWLSSKPRAGYTLDT
jgi:predicted dehydrogenase